MNKRFFKLSIRILLAAVLLIMIVLLFLNRERFYSPSRWKGGYGDYLHFSQGSIKEIDLENKKITVLVDEEDEFFSRETLILDGSHAVIHWDLLEPGQTITFSYLNFNPSDSELRIGDITHPVSRQDGHFISSVQQ